MNLNRVALSLRAPTPLRLRRKRLDRTGAAALACACLTGLGCSDSTREGADDACVSDTRFERLTASDTGPLALGAAEVARALSAAKVDAPVEVVLASDGKAGIGLAGTGASAPASPESYVIVPYGAGVMVVGSDPVGAMYGAYEVAERIDMDGAAGLALSTPIAGTPMTPVRGANLFLTLPDTGETSWWLHDESFWREYLDMLTRARINFLDLHGMYDLLTTDFPNLLPYFATSSTYRDLGRPIAEREKNLRMLQQIVDLAAQRGIRVGLMSYRSDLRQYRAAKSAEMVRVYTREAVADLATRVPTLWRIGFRVGESRQPVSFYQDTFMSGLHDAGTGVDVYARTWGTKKSDLLKLIDGETCDPVLEAKYNGEQLGPPYVIAGGVMHRWPGYSYENYLQTPYPYGFLFQIRGGGTHRIFRHASYDRIRRTVISARLGPARGFSFEAVHTFMPQRDTYHERAEDRFSPWSFRRDELQYLMFGRLAYDPNTSERVFRGVLRRRTGTDGLWEAVQAASDIVPWIQTAHTCSPDQRDFAPDLEWGGNVAYWTRPENTPKGLGPCMAGYQGPFDTFTVASPHDTADDLVHGRPTTRLSPTEVAAIVLEDVARAREITKVPIDATNPEARDVVRETLALADLGEYFAHKLRGAAALSVFAASARQDYLRAATAETSAADAAWEKLARDTAYIAPLEERMRMGRLGTPIYHWRLQVPWLADDPASISGVVDQVNKSKLTPNAALPPADAWLNARRAAGPGLGSLRVEPASGGGGAFSVTAVLMKPVGTAASVRILWKDFDGKTDWQSAPASGKDTVFRVALDHRPGMVAVEVASPDGGWRYPDVLRETPYVVFGP